MTSRFAAELLAEFQGDPVAVAKVVKVLVRYQGCNVYLPLHSHSRRDRVEAARQMLTSREKDRGEIVKAIRERFHVSERTAWGDIRRALQKTEENVSKPFS